MANEKRLIDAVRFGEVLDRYANAPHVTMNSAYSRCMRMAIDTCIELLEMQRTVDAVEVVHAEWKHKQTNSLFLWRLECSACGKVFDLIEGGYKYCPSCGAKMDGDGNGST